MLSQSNWQSLFFHDLKEEQEVIKTEDRLSRNLDDEDFTDAINEGICRPGASKVTDGMVIAIDSGNIRMKESIRKLQLINILLDIE
ncbi:MAG: hypothetical protein H6Q93_603 [Nitrospirae bacterium]|nr:hypothetical protein [Nitrospirota bacterium]